MKVGALLASFRANATHAIDGAQEGARVGLDGVFAYDHLWPMGSPWRPSLAPFALLARVASLELDLMLGPLVARVGLVGTNVLVEQIRTLQMLAPSKVLVALGTGDRLSESENLAYGLSYPSADQRRALIGEVVGALGSTSEIWIGGGARATNELARKLGAVLTLWNVPADIVRAHASDGPVSWAGVAHENLEQQLSELADAGARWAVFTPKVDLARLGRWRSAHLGEQ